MRRQYRNNYHFGIILDMFSNVYYHLNQMCTTATDLSKYLSPVISCNHMKLVLHTSN